MNKFITASITILVLSIGLWVLFASGQQSTAPEEYSEDDFLQAITSSFPAFIHNDTPVIKIAATSQHGKWYVTTIESLHPVKNPVPVRLVLLDDTNQLRVVAGPNAHFSELEMLSFNLPDSVILELRKT